MKIYILLFFIGVSVLALFRKRDNFRRGRRIRSGDSEREKENVSTLEIILLLIFYFIFLFFVGGIEGYLENYQS